MTIRRPAKALGHMVDALRQGGARDLLLVVNRRGRVLLEMGRGQLDLDDVRAELSRDLDGIADHVDRGFALLAQAGAARIGPDDDGSPLRFASSAQSANCLYIASSCAEPG